MADKSSILKESILDLNKLKQEAIEMAKREIISEAKNKIEENTKIYLEKMLFEGDEKTGESEVKTDDSDTDVTIEVIVPSGEEEGNDGTYINPSDEWNFPEHDEDKKIEENAMEATPTETTNVDLTQSPDMEALINEYIALEDGDNIEVEGGETPEAPVATEVPAEAPIEGEVAPEAPAEAPAEVPAGLEGEAPAEEEAPLEQLSEQELIDLEKQLDEELAALENPEKEVIAEDEEVIAEVPAEDETELEEASMGSDANLRHKNVKPVARIKNAEKINPVLHPITEAQTIYNKLAEEVQKLISENKTFKAKNDELAKLNEDLNSTLKETRGKLYEAAIITSKTAYVNSLLLENTTSQDQKNSIVESFNEAKTRKEMETLYEGYKASLKGGVQTLNEGIENKIAKSIGGNSSNAAPAYSDVASKFNRIMNYR